MRSFPNSAAGALAALVLAASPASASQQCHVTFGVDGSELLGGLELRVNYAAAAGTFNGTGEEVKCTGLAPASWQAARDDDAGTELDLGLVSGAGVPLPQDIWRCDFLASGSAPSADDFAFIIDEALTPMSVPLVVDPAVVDIACDSGAACGDSVIEGTEECDDGGATAACNGNCQLTRNSQRCAVTFVASGSGSLGGLQLGVDYSDASGAFQGEGVDVDCSQALASGYTAVDDVDAEQRLNLALISPGGLLLPTDLWTCTFVTSATPLVNANFHYLDVIATDTEAKAKEVTLSSTVSSCVYGPYCGDGTVDPEEVCDDGNNINTDSCTNSCTLPASLCGNGVKNSGEQCDDGNKNAGDCCSPTCTFESAATICRAAVGGCDVAETCTGTTATCPANVLRTSATVCRTAAGGCDVAESCTGVSAACPADSFKPSSTVCRASAGVCDVAESCTGASAACPVDAFQSSSTSCTDDSNACTNDKCNGAGVCAHTSNSAPCNDGLFCNGADTCGDGTCSLHAGSPCPGADGDADCSETCVESSDSCTGNDPDQSSCDDGNPDTSGDKCSAGICAGTSGTSTCGDANESGTLTSTDALKILRTSVGQPGTCPLSRCDTDKSGTITSSDALRVLKAAVGQPVILSCPA